MNRSRVTSNTSHLLGLARLLFDQGDDAVELVVEGGLLSAQLLDLGPQRGVVLLEAGGVLAQLAELGEQLFEGERRPPVLARFRRFILKRHDGRDPPLIARLVTLAVALIVEAAALATLRARADSRKWLGRFLFLDLR